jgi:hypothetical protein
MAAPTSVVGDTFVLVATNASGIELFGLVEDDQGTIYAGNNSNGPGIPLQRFNLSEYSNSPMQLQGFGPTCDDADGLSYGAGYLYAASLQGVRKISVTDGTGILLAPGVAANGTGSPLVVRTNDGHIFVGLGYQGGTGLNEYDATGTFVRTYPTTAEIETMTYDPASGTIYYAPYGSDVHTYNLNTSNDTIIATVNGSIDGALAFDSLSHRIFVGTANGANQGNVYTVDLSSLAVAQFATGFQGSLGILREKLSGDLYFLESQNLYRLNSSAVTNALATRLSIWPAVELGWPSDTNQLYQVQYRTDLDTNTWYNLGSPIQGNGTTNYFSDIIQGNNKRFYRVQLLP